MSGFEVRPAGVQQVAARLEAVGATVTGISRAVQSLPFPDTGRFRANGQLQRLLLDLEGDLAGLGEAVAREGVALRDAASSYRCADRSVMRVVR